MRKLRQRGQVICPRHTATEGLRKRVWGQAVLLRASLVAQTVKNLPARQETQVQSLGQEDSLGEGNGNLLQYSCLRNPWIEQPGRFTVPGVTKSQTRLSNFAGGQYIEGKIKSNNI